MSNNQPEKWVAVKGYENFYLISDCGNVWSSEKNIYKSHAQWGRGEYAHYAGKPIKSSDNGNGYLYVTLKNNGVRKNHYVHRLVAEAFIGEISGKVINHLDYNKKNNSVENIEITTQKLNVQYSVARMSKPRKSTSEIKYIYKRKYSFEVNINKNYIGCYKTLEEAKKIRDEGVEKCQNVAQA